MKATICLEKYSDWLEAYSAFVHYPQIYRVTIIFIENERNNKKAVESLFFDFKERCSFEYCECNDSNIFFKKIKEAMSQMQAGDILAAPFIRYRTIWANVPEARKRGITTIHLSESLPDSFGRLGYRLGFRLVGGFNLKGLIKQLISLPIMYVYANRHKPDICYYNLYPHVVNPFVRETRQAEIPSLDPAKKHFLKEKAMGEKRPLIISGFGYDLKKMVKCLNVDKYIATSKGREIIIDGINYPLDYYICAEEVLLSGCVDSIIGYNGTAVCWAKLIGNVRITCYEAKKLCHQYGFMYGCLTRRAFKKCGLKLLPERKDMLSE